MGTVFFVFTEALVDFKDYCGEDSCFSFTVDNIFYFWFGFVFANSVWFVVPAYYIRHSFKEIMLLEFVSEREEFANNNNNNNSISNSSNSNNTSKKAKKL